MMTNFGRKLTIIDNELTGSAKLGIENIKRQVGDGVVEQLKEQFRRLQRYSREWTTDYDGKKFFTNRDTKEIYKNIDNIIFDRFGIKVKHAYMRDMPYGIIANSGNVDTPIKRRMEDTYKMFRVMEHIGVPKKKNLEDINDMRGDSVAIYNKCADAIDDIDKTLNGRGVIVDNDNAVIKNLPKEFVDFILTDPHLLFKILKFTPEEATATLLHEVGHGYTHISYLYRTVNTTTALIDSLQESAKKGRTFKDKMTLVYGDVLNGNVDDLNGKTDRQIAIFTIDKAMSEVLGQRDSNRSSRDSEMLADQFAGRFGMHSEMATALEKMYTHRDTHGQIMVAKTYGGALAYVVIITLITGGIGAVLSAIAIFFIAINLSMLILYMVTYTLVGGRDGVPEVYDLDKKRYVRLRNDVIRSLRESTLSKNEVSTVLGTLDDLQEIIDKATNQKTPIVERISHNIVGMFSGRVAEKTRLAQTEEYIENLMDNELYVMGSKFKQLEGK